MYFISSALPVRLRFTFTMLADMDSIETEAPMNSPERSKKYYDETGNVEIISSDGVRFKIQSYHLQAFS